MSSATLVQKSPGSSIKNPDEVAWTKVRENPSQETGTRTRRTAPLDGAGHQQNRQSQDPTWTKTRSLGSTRDGEPRPGTPLERAEGSLRTTATPGTIGGSVTQRTGGPGERTGVREGPRPPGAPSPAQRSPARGLEEGEVRADEPHYRTGARDTRGGQLTGDVWIMCPRAKRPRQVRMRAWWPCWTSSLVAD